jgi:hypothetical protein
VRAAKNRLSIKGSRFFFSSKQLGSRQIDRFGMGPSNARQRCLPIQKKCRGFLAVKVLAPAKDPSIWRSGAGLFDAVGCMLACLDALHTNHSPMLAKGWALIVISRDFRFVCVGLFRSTSHVHGYLRKYLYAQMISDVHEKILPLVASKPPWKWCDHVMCKVEITPEATNNMHNFRTKKKTKATGLLNLPVFDHALHKLHNTTDTREKDMLWICSSTK